MPLSVAFPGNLIPLLYFVTPLPILVKFTITKQAPLQRAFQHDRSRLFGFTFVVLNVPGNFNP
jgi:hypothetical protein